MQLSLRFKAVMAVCFVLLFPTALFAGQMVSKIAAVVNGEMITIHDVQVAAGPEIVRQGLTGQDQKSITGRAAIMTQALDSMIADILLRQEAVRLKITVSDQEVQNELRKFIQRTQLTQDEFEQQIALQGGTMDKMRESIKNNVLRQRIMSIMIARRVVVTKDEVAAYYEEHKAQFVQQDSVKLSLIAFPPTVDPDKIVASIKKGDISFADAARKHSSNPTAADGGNLGSVAWKDLSPHWQDVLGKMKPGDISPVIPTGEEKVVLQLNSSLAGNSKTLADATPEIEEILRGPKLQERFDEYVKQLRSKAVVDIRI